MPKVRRIKKAWVQFVSLCARGANNQPILLKDDDSFELETLAKYQPSEGLLTTLVYVPNEVDSQGEFATADIVKSMAYDWALRGHEIDLNHDFKAIPRDKAYVAESFIVQKSDPRFEGWVDLNGKAIDPAGSWAQVIKLEDAGLRKAAEEGRIGGTSMGGRAVREEVELEAATEEQFQKALAALTKKQTPTPADSEPDDDSMKPEDLEAIQKSFSDALAPVVEALTKTAVPPSTETTEAETTEVETPEEPVIKFEGDRSNPEDLAKHAQKVRRAKLEGEVDWADAESVEKYAAELAKLDGEPEPEPQHRVMPAPSHARTQAAPADPKDATFVAKMKRLTGVAGTPMEKGAEDSILAARDLLKDCGIAMIDEEDL